MRSGTDLAGIIYFKVDPTKTKGQQYRHYIVVVQRGEGLLEGKDLCLAYLNLRKIYSI